MVCERVGGWNCEHLRVGVLLLATITEVKPQGSHSAGRLID